MVKEIVFWVMWFYVCLTVPIIYKLLMGVKHQIEMNDLNSKIYKTLNKTNTTTNKRLNNIERWIESAESTQSTQPSEQESEDDTHRW